VRFSTHCGYLARTTTDRKAATLTLFPHQSDLSGTTVPQHLPPLEGDVLPPELEVIEKHAISNVGYSDHLDGLA
jgi:hypothetical protein